MIDIKNLNDISAEQIFEDAKKQITYRNSEWTNFQESDPGITLLELFSWLKSAQHEYLNRISDGVKIKFLKLLDVSLQQNRGSEALLEVSNVYEDIELPIRTKWKSKGMIFENPNQQVLIKSKILNVVFENPESPSDEEYYRFDGKRNFYIFGKDTTKKDLKNFLRRFTINFDAPLPMDSVINIYFSVYVSKGLKRNPIGENDSFESMAKIKWEYYGEKNGVIGWHDINIINDDTHNFLFSGIIKMQLDGKTIPINQQYKLRATLEYDEYDYPPRIDNILPNVFKVIQNDTICQNIVIKKDDILSDRTVKIMSDLVLYGDSEIYFKKYGGWVRTELPTITRNIKSGESIVDLDSIWDNIKVHRHNDEVVMIVSYKKSMKKFIALASGTGISFQHVEMNLKNILFDGTEIMISEQVDGEEVFYKWTRVEDFFSSSKYDRHYVLDKSINTVIFGDHEHGMAPRKGYKNIRFCALTKTFGENSNTKEHIINSVISKHEALKDCRIVQITDATMGKDKETFKHAEARAAELFDNPQRAVTVEDYERIVRSTPGLMFNNVKILPNYMPGEDIMKQNCVTIAVRWNRKVGLSLPKSFENNIMNHLEKYRIMNTKIKVLGPEYIGLVIAGEIVVNSYYRVEDRLIESEIKDFIERTNKDMGVTLHFGDLFGMIENLKYVSNVNKLRILPIGDNSTKSDSEDIIIPPNGVYYVDKIDFSYIRSSEIYKS